MTICFLLFPCNDCLFPYILNITMISMLGKIGNERFAPGTFYDNRNRLLRVRIFLERRTRFYRLDPR